MPYEAEVSFAQTLHTPTRCVSCGNATPDTKITLWAPTERYGAYLSDNVFKPFTAELPCCSKCKNWVRMSRWLGFALSLVMLALSVVIFAVLLWCASVYLPAVAYSKKAGLGIQIFWTVIFVILIFAQIKLQELIFVPPVKVTRNRDRLRFQFKDKAYADEFKQLNASPAASKPA